MLVGQQAALGGVWLPEWRRVNVTRSARLSLLGDFRLVVEGSELDLPVASQRLLAVLGLRGRTSRCRLASALWPDRVEERAMASLRTGLWRVNNACAHLLHATSGAVDLAEHVWVDVRELRQRSYSAGDAPGGVVRHRLPPLEQDWELLPEWEDEWLAPERERLRQLRLHAMDSDARSLAAHKHYGAAVDVALAAVCVDPLRESAHRTLIAVHIAEGNVAEADRALQECRRVLMSELGIDVSPLTRRLVESLREEGAS